MKTLLSAVLGVMAGVAIGWGLFSVPATGPVAPPALAPAPPVAMALPTVVPSRREAPVQPPPPSLAPAGTPSPVPSETVVRLEEQIRALEAKVASCEAMSLERQGAPVERPASLEPRFEQEAVRTSVNAALKELGLEGEVTAIDCTEYPCLATGELSKGHFGRDESTALSRTSAMSRYTGDSKSGFGATRGEGKERRAFFGVAVFPQTPDEATHRALSKRLSHRFEELKGNPP